MLRRITMVLLVMFLDQGFADRSISIYGDDPVVLGANVTFRAIVKPDDTSSMYRFTWTDNATPQNQGQFITNVTESSWTINYPISTYEPGEYNVNVKVEKSIIFSIFWLPVISGRKYFNVTGFLNGHMNVTQGKKIVTGNYLEVNKLTKFDINLSNPDYNYLVNYATSVKTYWFVDCIYYGITTDYEYTETFTNLEGTHYVAGIVEASFEPLPPIPTTTTTTTSTTTTSTTTTSTTTTTTTQAPPKSSTMPEEIITELEQTSQITEGLNTEVPSSNRTIVKRQAADTKDTDEYAMAITNMEESNFNPYICQNQTFIPNDPKKLYGLFIRKVIVQETVSNISINGNNWLQHGDILTLQVKCHGTPPFEYCTRFRPGNYNVTGNETCVSPQKSMTCDFPVIHYFSETDVHTVVLIVSNNLAKVVYPVTITVYKVSKQAQLSVIVVPVAFSILAAILVVFGVAYYIQNRSKFTVEVADFDFAQQYTDMEYKTFKERLRDSFNNALSWGGGAAGSSTVAGGGGEHNLPSTSNNKYGSMT